MRDSPVAAGAAGFAMDPKSETPAKGLDAPAGAASRGFRFTEMTLRWAMTSAEAFAHGPWNGGWPRGAASVTVRRMLMVEGLEGTSVKGREGFFAHLGLVVFVP